MKLEVLVIAPLRPAIKAGSTPRTASTNAIPQEGRADSCLMIRVSIWQASE
jgi:hypothetical protein